MKRTTVTATYRIDTDELIQCSISVPHDAYPQVMDQAAATVKRMMREQLADVLRQTRETVDE